MRILPLFLLFLTWAQTEAENIRPFTTDRPSKTDGTYSVPKGHFQLEADAINYTRDRAGATETETASVAAVNIKYGLTANSDLQVIAMPRIWKKVNTTGSRVINYRGAGPTVVRYKLNFTGNDGGPISAAVIPLVKIPTNPPELGNKKTEFGLSLPLSLAFPNGFYLCSMVYYFRALDAADHGFHSEITSTLMLSRSFGDKLSAYAELAGVSSDDVGAQWKAYGDIGVLYLVTPSLQVDVGANFGLTRAADDFNGFLGVASRF